MLLHIFSASLKATYKKFELQTIFTGLVTMISVVLAPISKLVKIVHSQKNNRKISNLSNSITIAVE